LKEEDYIVTPLQVENKFETLERTYKNMMSNNKKLGEDGLDAVTKCMYELCK